MTSVSSRQFILTIPAHNEADIIALTLKEIVRVFEARCSIPWQIIVVDNMSTDATALMVEGMQDARIKLLRLNERGKGRAVRAGFKMALSAPSGEKILGFTDADLPVHPDYILSALEMVLEGKAEVIIGTRFAKASNMSSRTAMRRLSSLIFHYLGRMILHLDTTDSQCPLKVMNERIARVMLATSDPTWWADLEFVVLLKNLQIPIAHIPVIWNEDRYAGRKSTLAVVSDGIKAVRAMFHIRRKIPRPSMKISQKYLGVFIVCLVVCSLGSLLFFQHIVADGDEVSYIDAMNVLSGSPLPDTSSGANFAIHRILTTFLGLEVISALSFVFGNIIFAWLAWETLLYFLVNITFYKLLQKMFKSPRTALIGGLFFATNYAMVTAGLGLFMDIGGWAFYIFSTYFLYCYIESGQRRELWLATLAISAGAFFKENALVAYVPLFSVLAYEHYFKDGLFQKKILESTVLFIKQIVPLSLVIFVPIAVHHVDVYLVFNHGYLYWVTLNQEVYHYGSRALEYVKSFGSLLTFLAPLSLVGFVLLLKSSWSKASRMRLWGEFGLDTKRAVFIASVLVSSIPAIMWPGITQRVLFMVVPGLVMVACFFIKRHEKYWYVFLGLAGIYAVCSFLMNPYILNLVNLPF